MVIPVPEAPSPRNEGLCSFPTISEGVNYPETKSKNVMASELFNPRLQHPCAVCNTVTKKNLRPFPLLTL